MLVVFFGTSCVGKTTIMRYLQKHYHWKIISVYTTRPQRQEEFEKHFVSLDYLLNGVQQGNFLPLNQCYGNYYGTPVSELQEAEYDPHTFWFIDYPLEKSYLLNGYKYMGISILAENYSQLIHQISMSGRLNRKKIILEEYKQFYTSTSNIEFPTVINYANNLEKTCTSIIHFAEQYRSKLYGCVI